MNIRSTKAKKTLVIDSEMGSENETHGTGERWKQCVEISFTGGP